MDAAPPGGTATIGSQPVEAVPVDGKAVFPFLRLPRELRDQIYNYAFAIPDDRGEQALVIERRHLAHFEPSAASILLLLHHDYFLLNRQVAREALDALFKNHTVYWSCGPYVLKQLLTHIEYGFGRKWLQCMKRIELNWITFPNLRMYPPERSGFQDEWWWENDGHEVDVDYVRGAQYSGHYDEYDHAGGYYDDNFYEPEDESFYPPWPDHNAPTTASNDPFGFSRHYPFADPLRQPTSDDDAGFYADDMSTKLDLLVSLEVTPLFEYLCSPVFAISSITLPLHFISKSSYQNRRATRQGYTLPLKIRYWVHVCVHAMVMLHGSFTLRELRVKYKPQDLWASMEPADSLQRIMEKGVWFKESEDRENEREGEGEAFRLVWQGLQNHGVLNGDDRMGLSAEINFVKWEGDLDDGRVGDELEVVFTDGTKESGKR